MAECDLVTYEEATKDEKWKIVVDREIDAMKRNNTWELTSLLEGHKALEVKWAYKLSQRLIKKEKWRSTRQG